MRPSSARAARLSRPRRGCARRARRRRRWRRWRGAPPAASSGATRLIGTPVPSSNPARVVSFGQQVNVPVEATRCPIGRGVEHDVVGDRAHRRFEASEAVADCAAHAGDVERRGAVDVGVVRLGDDEHLVGRTAPVRADHDRCARLRARRGGRRPARRRRRRTAGSCLRTERSRPVRRLPRGARTACRAVARAGARARRPPRGPS